MNNVDPNYCSCCHEIGTSDWLTEIKFGTKDIRLCPECLKEFNNTFERKTYKTGYYVFEFADDCGYWVIYVYENGNIIESYCAEEFAGNYDYAVDLANDYLKKDDNWYEYDIPDLSILDEKNIDTDHLKDEPIKELEEYKVR